MILVVKLSGKVLEELGPRRAICRQLAELSGTHRLLVIHGAGRQLDDLSRKLGIPIVQHQGRRVTDEATLQAAKMVFAAVNRDLVAGLAVAGARAIGMSAYDAGLTVARRRPPLPIAVTGPDDVRLVDFGWVGEIETVDFALVHQLWALNLLPVIASLCADRDGNILNINADTLAAELAVSLQADRLVSVSDVDGIFLDPAEPSTRILALSAVEARRRLREGCFTAGMIPKVETALKALEQGVKAVQVVSGLRENGLLEALEAKAGTLLAAQ